MLQLQVTIMNRYCVQNLLRRGGMSEIYVAYDPEAQQEVAIKLVSSDDPDCFKRLQREVRLLSALVHPHILPTLDQGEYEGWYYLVMPYMRRGTLRERLAVERLSLEEAGEVLEQVTEALQFAHERGIVHRDIKPSNILLGNDEGIFYLADFGLAKVIEEGSDITQTGCLVGTPEYMAPELTTKPESVSSDIYALGILLYQMLAGQLPFKGGTPLSIYLRHLREQPVPPSYINPAIPFPVEQVILRALEKDPGRRFATAREMAEAYQQALALVDGPEGVHDVSQGFAPAHVEVKKTNQVKLPAVSWAALLGKRARFRVQTAFVACTAILMLFVLPLTLGFVMARGEITSSLIVGASANFAATSLRPMHPYPATPVPKPVGRPVITTTPSGYHSNTGTNERADPPPQGHGRKHGHDPAEKGHAHEHDYSKHEQENGDG
ncbi:MAG TPA: serine/threonine-protein kinase [Ktedonobacteraceae bacterium]